MEKIKITADGVLTIIKSILDDEDVNTVITDPSAPPDWQGRTIQDILNVEYFTFKHRPVSTAAIIAQKIKEGAETNALAALDRGFCSVVRGEIERLFSKDVDVCVLSPTMEYWIQSDKVKLLEDLIEDCNVATSGLRFPVKFGIPPKAGEADTRETRQAVIIFNGPNVVDIQTGTACGEMAVCEVTVSLLLYPDVVSYSDYTVSFEWLDGDENKTATVPLTSLSTASIMTQKAVPFMNAPYNTGEINLARANGWVLVFDGYNNPFINYVSDKAFSEQGNNNQVFSMTIKRADKTYVHDVVIQDHQIIVTSDTGNETHTLKLSPKGVNYGTT